MTATDQGEAVLAHAVAAAALPGRELIPLYPQFIDDHVARLAAADCDDLAGRFRRWRARLRA